MVDKSWKAFERKIARALGTHRTPLSGSASRHTSSDTLHEQLYVECKLRRSSALDTYFRSIRHKAEVEGKLPVFVSHKLGSSLTLASIEWEFFLHLWNFWAQQGQKHVD